MSTALVSAFYDVGDMFKNTARSSTQLRGDNRAVGTPINGMRRHSTSSQQQQQQQSSSPPSGSMYPLSNNPLSNSIHRSNSVSCSSSTTSISVFHSETLFNKDGKIRERSLSESDHNQRNQNSSRYKTELCRPFEESGACKYGDKCQFAHGYNELRNLSRHPKYKTELCRTFHTVGFCPYGPRCHFIHNPEERKLAALGPPPGHSPPGHSPNNNLNKRDRQERPKLLHFPSAPVGLSTGGDLTPPYSICDSPNPLTPPPNYFTSEDALHCQEFLASLAAASALSGINPAFIGQDLTPLLSPGPLSPAISGLQSPFLNLQLNDLDNGHDNVFFSPEDSMPNINGMYRPPSPPDSDPESLADSLGPASPLPAISLPSRLYQQQQQQRPPMQFPMKQQPRQQQQQQQQPPLSPGALGRLPIFRGISMEDRF